MSYDEIRQQCKGWVTAVLGNPIKCGYVTMDLITSLPESKGVMAIVVFVHKLMKMVHLAGCKKEVTAMEYAQIFIDNIFWLHNLLEVIISGRGSHFAGKSGVFCSTCLVWIFGLVLHFICKQMASWSG